MIILGLNAYHGDSSACLLVDGKLVAAVEEERFLPGSAQCLPAVIVAGCFG